VTFLAVPVFSQSNDKKTPLAASSQPEAAGKKNGSGDGSGAVEFLKGFRLGMTYKEVQEALPKSAEQDALSYVSGENTFLLNVDLSESGDWTASFRFDTSSEMIRQPEHLVELSCTASLSSKSQSFDNLVAKVTAAFGEPVKVDTQTKILQAGWRVIGGSTLILEYSVMPNSIGNNVTVEFTVRKSPGKKTRTEETA
jgi:hypothetical protein